MGDVIRKISEIQIGGATLDVELNHSTRSNGFRDIHLQNDKFRLEISENEFLQMAACVLLAKKQFDILKSENGGEKCSE